MTVLNSTKPTYEQLQAEIAALKTRNERKVTLKVSTKGALSIYGLGRFPVTLYRSQIEKVVAMVKDGSIEAFIAANTAALATKE